MALIWLTSRRDLSWRKRRLAMAVAGTTMAFAVTLLLTGVREGIDVEANRTVRSLGADAFVLSDSGSGPFTSLAQLPTGLVRRVQQLPGVEDTGAIVSVRHTISSDPVTDVYLVGAQPGRVGMPDVRKGRAPRSRGEAAIGSAAGRSIGDEVELGGQRFEIVGVLPGASVWLNVPVMFVTLADAQALVFEGAPAATALVTRGVPEELIAGLQLITPAAALSDLKRPLKNAITNIVLIQVLLWGVAVAIVGSILYVSALERSRDFAVFKAFGTRSIDLAGALLVEATAIACAAAVGAIAVSRPLGSIFPAVISYPAWSVLLLPGIAVAIGILGALAGARRAMAIDPAEAFGSR